MDINGAVVVDMNLFTSICKAEADYLPIGSKERAPILGISGIEVDISGKSRPTSEHEHSGHPYLHIHIIHVPDPLYIMCFPVYYIWFVMNLVLICAST